MIEEVHEFLASLSLLLIVLHVAGELDSATSPGLRARLAQDRGQVGAQADVAEAGERDPDGRLHRAEPTASQQVAGKTTFVIRRIRLTR